MIHLTTRYMAGLLLAVLLSACQSEPALPTFRIELPATETDTTFDGRLLLMLSTGEEGEPRFQISDGLNTQLAYGRRRLGDR